MKSLLLFLLLALPGAAFAQSEVRLPGAYLRQPGTGLNASELSLVQTGQLNYLRVQDSGTGNRVRIAQQGSGNALDLDLTGIGTEFSFGQWGNDNVTQWRARSQQGGSVEVLQRGDRNRLVQDGSTAMAGVPMRIEQSGGMTLLLKSGN